MMDEKGEKTLDCCNHTKLSASGGYPGFVAACVGDMCAHIKGGLHF